MEDNLKKSIEMVRRLINIIKFMVVKKVLKKK